MSEILEIWRQLIKIEKQKTGQWGGRQFLVNLFQIDRVVQHYDTVTRQRDRAVKLLVKYSEMCACEGLGNLEQDSKLFLAELKEADDAR